MGSKNLMARMSEWPGVHAAPALLPGTALEGIWINRTAEYLARQRGETPGPQSFEEPETLILEPLPCLIREEPDRICRRTLASPLRPPFLKSTCEALDEGLS
jgi:hypothetical protein